MPLHSIRYQTFASSWPYVAIGENVYSMLLFRLCLSICIVLVCISYCIPLLPFSLQILAQCFLSIVYFVFGFSSLPVGECLTMMYK